MAVRDDRRDVKQTTTGFRGPLMVQSLTSAKSKFLSLEAHQTLHGFREAQVPEPLRRSTKQVYANSRPESTFLRVALLQRL